MGHRDQHDLPASVLLEGVSRTFRIGSTTVDAVRDVDLAVGPGEFVVILGASGCGKTTLLNLIGALDSPTSGRILLGGLDITRLSARERFAVRRRSVGFIFQSFNLFMGLTAAENGRFGAEVAGRSGAGDIATQLLEHVGLAGRGRHFPHELSGGEQQRVAIARALATGNPVLLADEPTGELDFHTGIQILELLRAHADEGRCVLVVTHNREISRAAGRVVEMSSGAVVADGPPEGGTRAISELRW